MCNGQPLGTNGAMKHPQLMLPYAQPTKDGVGNWRSYYVGQEGEGHSKGLGDAEHKAGALLAALLF